MKLAMALTAFSLWVPWIPGSQQAPFAKGQDFHHGSAEICIVEKRRLVACELLSRSRRVIK